MLPVDKWSLPGNGSLECPFVITVRRLTPLTWAAIFPQFNSAAAIDQLSGAGSFLSVCGSLGGPGGPAGLPEPPSVCSIILEPLQRPQTLGHTEPPALASFRFLKQQSRAQKVQSMLGKHAGTWP